LFFQLYSHATLYVDGGDDFKSTKYPSKEKNKDRTGRTGTGTGTDLGSATPPTDAETQNKDEDEDAEKPQLSLLMTIGLLAVVTVVRFRAVKLSHPLTHTHSSLSPLLQNGWLIPLAVLLRVAQSPKSLLESFFCPSLEMQQVRERCS
jgi:hypothetical protein